MNVIIEVIIGLALLIVIAFPERFLPVQGERRKRVGPSYWGLYEGHSQNEEPMAIDCVTIKKKDDVVAGSTSYALGRGVNMAGK